MVVRVRYLIVILAGLFFSTCFSAASSLYSELFSRSQELHEVQPIERRIQHCKSFLERVLSEEMLTTQQRTLLFNSAFDKLASLVEDHPLKRRELGLMLLQAQKKGISTLKRRLTRFASRYKKHLIAGAAMVLTAGWYFWPRKTAVDHEKSKKQLQTREHLESPIQQQVIDPSNFEEDVIFQAMSRDEEQDERERAAQARINQWEVDRQKEATEKAKKANEQQELERKRTLHAAQNKVRNFATRWKKFLGKVNDTKREKLKALKVLAAAEENNVAALSLQEIEEVDFEGLESLLDRLEDEHEAEQREKKEELWRQGMASSLHAFVKKWGDILSQIGENKFVYPSYKIYKQRNSFELRKWGLSRSLRIYPVGLARTIMMWRESGDIHKDITNEGLSSLKKFFEEAVYEVYKRSVTVRPEVRKQKNEIVERLIKVSVSMKDEPKIEWEDKFHFYKQKMSLLNTQELLMSITVGELEELEKLSTNFAFQVAFHVDPAFTDGIVKLLQERGAYVTSRLKDLWYDAYYCEHYTVDEVEWKIHYMKPLIDMLVKICELDVEFESLLPGLQESQQRVTELAEITEQEYIQLTPKLGADLRLAITRIGKALQTIYQATHFDEMFPDSDLEDLINRAREEIDLDSWEAERTTQSRKPLAEPIRVYA